MGIIGSNILLQLMNAQSSKLVSYVNDKSILVVLLTGLS